MKLLRKGYILCVLLVLASIGFLLPATSFADSIATVMDFSGSVTVDNTPVDNTVTSVSV